MSKLGLGLLPGRIVVGAAALMLLLLSTACLSELVMGGYSYDEMDGMMMPGDYDGDGARGMMSGGWAAYGGGEWVGPYDGPQGIYVNGNGTASGAPDIAVLNMGVESLEDTAAEARANAAAAMAGVMEALSEAGVADSDIQTYYFSISPRYRNVQVEGDWDYVLAGYTVSNQVRVKIRDLDSAGAVIDAVTGAAGDMIRVNGIDFGIEDPRELQDAARAEAIADMERKAGMMAEAAGVKLGRLVYLSEAEFYPTDFAVIERAVALDAGAGAPTGISGGELDVTASVQGAYLILEAADPAP